MKKALMIAVVCVMALSSLALAQRGTASAEINGKNVEVEYGRPSLQGRDMLSQLPVGGTWRMGMNAATTLKTDGTLSFGDTKIKPGTYTLTAKRAEQDKWHLVFKSDDAAVEVPLMNGKADESVEQFTISLDSVGGNKGVFSMAWGSLSVGAQFSVD